MKPIALSTSFLPGEIDPDEDRSKILLAFDVRAYELCAPLRAGDLAEILREVRGAGREIVSVHHSCPGPSRRVSLSGAQPRLVALDDEERRAAVEGTHKALEWADRAEARIVVIDGGMVAARGLREACESLAKLATDPRSSISDRAAGRGVVRDLQATAAERHLDALRRALDPLLVAADGHGVTIALRHSGLPDEAPSAEEALALVQEFRGAPLATWLDPARAMRLEKLGFLNTFEIMETLAPSLVGTYLHDVRGLDDGLPPGTGELDFALLLGALAKDVRRVVRCASGSEATAVRTALESLAGGDDDDLDADAWQPFLPIIGGD